MPSQATVAFEENREDVERLMEIHGELVGDTPGQKRGVEVLNESAIVLMCAVWEAYCEDLVAETVEHLVTHVTDASLLPKTLRKIIAAELITDNNDLATWGLAGDGWKRSCDLGSQISRSSATGRSTTPKSEKIDALFETTAGLRNVSASWRWSHVSAATARAKLDGYVTQRGDVAHRSKAASSIEKSHATRFVKHAERLVEATDEHVNQLTATCGAPLF